MTKPQGEGPAPVACPFCGSAARECYNGDVPFGMYWVLCEKCHASPGDRPSREEALAAWNRRAAPAPDLAGLRERVAIAIRDAIWTDINGRKGFDFYSLDDDVQDEIRAAWDDAILSALIPKGG